MTLIFYEEEVKLTKEMFDNYGLSNNVILEMFQLVARNHATSLKCGYHELIQRNLIWVVVRNRYEVIKQPKENETVKVITWPHKANRLEYDREYAITSLSGEVYIKGDSKWCIIDKTTKKFYMGNDILTEGNFLDKHNFDTPLRAIPNKNFKELPISYQETIPTTYIDNNEHLNNAKYALMIDHCLKDYKVNTKHFEINYVKETMLNETMEFKVLKENNDYCIECSVNQEIRAKAKVSE